MTSPPAGFWEPPQDFSPEKAFPPVVATADVSMGDVTASPGSVNKNDSYFGIRHMQISYDAD